jgi:hypothetical protein
VIAGIMALSTILPLLVKPPSATWQEDPKVSRGPGSEMAWKR